MGRKLKADINSVEHRLKVRVAKREAKLRRRMPLHGAGLKKLGKIWEKRLQEK